MMILTFHRNDSINDDEEYPDYAKPEYLKKQQRISICIDQISNDHFFVIFP